MERTGAKMIVSLINLKGGVGKTTSCIALATAAARAGKEVVVLDAAPQGSATFWADNAEDNGEELPFAVDAANPATVKRAAKKFKGDPAAGPSSIAHPMGPSWTRRRTRRTSSSCRPAPATQTS